MINSLIGILPIVAIIVALFVVVIVAINYRLARDYKRLMESYSHRTQNIYVRSESPEDYTVFKRAQEERKLLAESGNETMVCVIEFYYRDGSRPGSANESWEEFEQYCKDEAARQDEQRERWLNKQGRNWYLAKCKHQRGIRIEE